MQLFTWLGKEAWAAIGLATALASLLLGSLSAMSRASRGLVARAKGAADSVRLKSTFWSAIFNGLAIAKMDLILAWPFADTLFNALAQLPSIAAQALVLVLLLLAVRANKLVSLGH